jgi:hypothetical protein
VSWGTALARWAIFLGCMSCMEVVGFGTFYALVQAYWQ